MLSPVSRAPACVCDLILGLAPQALCCRPLRGLCCCSLRELCLPASQAERLLASGLNDDNSLQFPEHRSARLAPRQLPCAGFAMGLTRRYRGRFCAALHPRNALTFRTKVNNTRALFLIPFSLHGPLPELPNLLTTT